MRQINTAIESGAVESFPVNSDILSDEFINDLQYSLIPLSLEERLALFRKHIGGKITFSTSLGPEDQIITDALLKSGLDIEIFTLDTGRLFPETYNLLAETQALSGNKIKIYYPDMAAIEKFTSEKGINSFYDAVENRKTCCAIRKIEPLGRALIDARGWITGLRGSQSQNRTEMPIIEADHVRGLLKFNPLIDWSLDAVWARIKDEKIPYNALHDQSFPSIGCAPCTRAVAADEDERSGRWWWEAEDKKECGLHIQNGKITRKSAA